MLWRRTPDLARAAALSPHVRVRHPLLVGRGTGFREARIVDRDVRKASVVVVLLNGEIRRVDGHDR